MRHNNQMSGGKKHLVTNKKELEKRLLQRNQDKKQTVEKRLKSYDEDITHWSDYDYVVINDNLENCFRQIEKIIEEKKNKYLN